MGQLDTLPFAPRRYTNAAAVDLATKLGALAPDPLGKVLFEPGGTLAIGMAVIDDRLYRRSDIDSLGLAVLAIIPPAPPRRRKAPRTTELT